ncbi:LysM peptidoglycan-binding domain-containing protein [Brevibacillus laterosporus]|uniref:Spore germination protein YaaH n=1 Tax=Brevibacillus laterosporus LMG 15441 TaxID=1042163 RepID=A0A075R758_BRELA|nr:glycoside hydrolase family 18 protein [Brevibacillus laterosporus]AIG27038.1 spore germination protein YaaH [Brevibacillus laterosporus LMG 15441]RJL14707.1 LysM peptidoglycan-binding domain-containing protein [Brevibacillus laterosporus]TPH09482.1 LysM peptidoglycan-binding domain-containing protein [Brevibacillus laterosporus]
MIIYVVRPGDSLYKIANRYKTSVEQIANDNDLTPQQTLVVGQSLVIVTPKQYTVQPGDSLYEIALRFNVSVQQLAAANNLSASRPIYPGMVLTIPQAPKPTIEVNAYIEPRRNIAMTEQIAQESVPYLTYLAPFSYQIKRDGSLTSLELGDLPRIATSNGATLMMVITNIENNQFSAELGQEILNDEQKQNRMLDEIIQRAKRYGFSDIHFDIEHLYPKDREAYNQFLRKARDRLHANGLMISTALAPKTSATQQGQWYEAHDYRAHGEIVDFVIIMTYEWGYSGGPPMAVSPIGPVRRVLEYALTEIPAKKIMMGQNLYGYDWTLPYRPGGKFAKVVSPKEAVNLARRYQQSIQFDPVAQAPHFRYFDEQGREHEVWFEDARSMRAKFSLLKELHLRGISYWRLGIPFKQNWVLLDQTFKIKKS